MYICTCMYYIYIYIYRPTTMYVCCMYYVCIGYSPGWRQLWAYNTCEIIGRGRRIIIASPDSNNMDDNPNNPRA